MKHLLLLLLLSTSTQADPIKLQNWSFSPVGAARDIARNQGLNDVVTTCSWKLFKGTKVGTSKLCSATSTKRTLFLRVVKQGAIKYKAYLR